MVHLRNEAKVAAEEEGIESLLLDPSRAFELNCRKKREKRRQLSLFFLQVSARNYGGTA